jgi:flavin-dependent dehydrogenase
LISQNGYKVTVYEKEAYVGERVREWTMLIHWALPMFQSLLPDDILNEIRSAYTDPFYPYDKEKESLPVYDGDTGDILFHVPAIGMRRVSRTRLRRLCTRGLEIHWSKTFKDLRMEEAGPVTICFEDGDTAQADFVIGTDGSNSKVRQCLVGEAAGKVSASDYVICNGVASYNDSVKAKYVRASHPISTIGYCLAGSLFIAGECTCQVTFLWRGVF